MATDPNTLLPAPPPEDLALAGRIRAALASKDTSTKDIEDIITAAGREVTDEMRNVIAANVDFVRQGGDIDLVTFNFLPLVQPEPTPTSLSTFFPDGAEAPRYTDTIASRDPTFQERAYRFVLEQAAPFFGADPKQSREAAELLVGRREAPRAALMDITPLAALTSLPEGASTFSTGVRFGEPGTAALGALETAGGVAEALPLAGALFRGSRRFAREFTRTSPAARGAVSREAVEASSPSQIPPTAPAPRPPLTPIERIAQAPELPPAAPRAAAPDVPPVSAEQRAEDAFSLDVRIPRDETQPILTTAKQKEIMAYQADYARLLNERGITQPKGRTQSEWIQSHMQAETIPVDDLLPIMQRHNVTSLEDQLRAAGISRESLSRSGRDLNQASQLRRLLLRAAQENPQLAEQLGVGADAIKEASSVHRRLMGIESALLTTQVKTIIRNLVGATPQMPAFTMVEELTDAAIRGARNLGRAPEDRLLGPSIADPLYAFWDTVGGSLVDAARATADAGISRATRGRYGVSRSARALRDERTISELRDAFPNEYSTLFGRYASDQVSRGPSNTAVGKALSGVERALDVAHIGTRTMDRWVKNTQFPVLLDMELRRVGRSLDEVFDAGDFASIPEPVLDNAIRRMHKRVFEDRPEGPEWYNRASRSFIDLLNYTLRPAGLAPFPNFMVSFGKYVFEQNPAAVVRFASKAERKKIAEGDARAIGKIAAGLAGTLAWSAYKDFDDGTDWFEFYNPDGEVVDVSAAAAPSLPSLWQAYLLHKYNTGRLNEVKWSKDIAKVVGASNMRAGFNGYMVDSGFADIIDAARQGRSAEQIQNMFGEYMAQRVGGWSLILRNFRDIAAESGLQDTTLRTPETVAQTTMLNLPFGVEMYTGITGEEIPARFAPTRAGPLQEQDPLLGQLTGGFFRGERNPLEKQLIRLGVAPSSLNRASGISDTYDRLLTAEIGDIAEKQLLPFLDERAPLGETPEKQRLLLGDEYTKIRKAARNRVLQNYPIYRFATTYENLSRDEKRLADKKNMEDPQRGRSVPEFVSEVESIDPAMPVVRKSGPARELDLAAIPSGTAYADGLTFTVKVKP